MATYLDSMNMDLHSSRRRHLGERPDPPRYWPHIPPFRQDVMRSEVHSPTTSILSFKSDESMFRPINFSYDQLKSPSPTPSDLSYKSDDSMSRPIHFRDNQPLLTAKIAPMRCRGSDYPDERDDSRSCPINTQQEPQQKGQSSKDRAFLSSDILLIISGVIGIVLLLYGIFLLFYSIVLFLFGVVLGIIGIASVLILVYGIINKHEGLKEEVMKAINALF
ncbi:uncharacterized protein LOC127634720 isoform X2 [Xyrauchen texanus]|uniref:uncharacterized protein LOC127634720 isoform X2 n=1 Tax=Xyrauchen texanus TaxID=154827 RepID=UPI002241D46C|nr:uncharacterized protein LOC127634720 isoform X2 [Xyrauchen texanus]